MIYFDNAATSFPKAPGVADAMARFIHEAAANPGRAGHRMAIQAERMIDDTRLKLTRYFDGDDPQRMIFTLNTTDALNMAIKGVLPALASGGKPHVITTVLEHNSVSRPLVALQQSGAIELTRIDCDEAGFIDPAEIRKAIYSRTRLIVMTHASNVLGTIQDAAAVGAIAREHNLLFLLDAAQTAGVLPISIKKMNVDMLAFPGHKSLLGPTGTGGLYVGERCPQPPQGLNETNSVTETGRISMQAWREGGTGGDSSTPTQPGLFPYYLEGGTPNTVGIAGLAAGLNYVIEEEGKALHHEQSMVHAIVEILGNHPKVSILGTRDARKRVGTVSLLLEGYEPADVGSILDDSFNIAVRPGLHCSPYAHKRMGTFPGGAVRVSPGPFNTQEQLDQLIEALLQIVE